METNRQFLGEKLRIARLFYGYSQNDVAELISTSRQYVHQLETGGKLPSPELVKILCDKLQVHEHYFVSAFGNAVKPDQIHFRKLRTTPAAQSRQAMAHAALLDELIAWLNTKVILPEVNFPDFDIVNNEDIERAAERAREHWGLGLTKPIKNMARIVESAGAIFVCFPHLSDKIDAFSVSRPRPLIIRSTAKKSACRMRFDLSHETAHLIMHKGIETGDHDTERQAHRFAGAFLIPRVAFVSEFPKNRRLDWVGIYEMKIRWKVSVGAIIRRAYDLGLIDDSGYRRGNVYLSKTGQKKSERYDELRSSPIAGQFRD